MQNRRTILAGAAAFIGAGPAGAAPDARLSDRRWTSFGGAGDPDYGAWDRILRAGVRNGADGIARFDYARADHLAVEGLVTALEAIDPRTLGQAAAFAYWVNLYNAVTVRTVLRAWPVGSIRDIGGGLFSPGPWKDELVLVAGQGLSLDTIEHGILRPIWRDARVHYAVNCAALGCPNLAPRAYRSDRLTEMLDAGARAYVNHPRGVSLAGGGLTVSSIYDWYAADFGASDAAVIDHFRRYAEPPLKAALAERGRIGGYAYDWRINARG